MLHAECYVLGAVCHVLSDVCCVLGAMCCVLQDGVVRVWNTEAGSEAYRKGQSMLTFGLTLIKVQALATIRGLERWSQIHTVTNSHGHVTVTRANNN